MKAKNQFVTPAQAGVHSWTPAFLSRVSGATAGVAILFAATSLHAADIPTNTAVLRALDKVTARVQTLEVPVGTPVQFGRLDILAKTCITRPPEETPESSVLLQIDKTVGQTKTKIFDGWMFASSPDLSAMDDPVYDIWVLSCENRVVSKSR
jgi:hypothetical protein